MTLNSLNVTGHGHTKPRAIVSCILIVTWLALLVTQLSGKYYFCASYPYYSSGQSSAARVEGMVTSGAKDIQILSLDKRFDGKHTYALPSPVFGVTALAPVRQVFGHEPATSLYRILPPAPQQRGPPFGV